MNYTPASCPATYTPALRAGARVLLVACLASIILALTLFFPAPPSAHAATITVTSFADGMANPLNCPSPNCRLRDAIAAANPAGGDIINFSLAYPATITLLSSELQITKSLTINGPGATNLTISGGHSKRVMYVSATDPVTVSNVTIANGKGTLPGGGGIYNNGSIVIINNTTFYLNNALSGVGGGIFSYGTLTVTNSVFANNTARGGGAIANSNSSVVSINNTTFYNNSATGSFGGGGLFNYSQVTINSSTFSGNSSTSYGGGISNWNNLTYSGTLLITNTTFFGNSASNAGGGIYNAGVLTLTHGTLSGNSASPFGGGGINALLVATLRNTIVANSPSGENCAGTITSLGYNLDNTTTCAFAAIGDLTNTNPLLAPLGNYGGATQTMPLLVGSQAIDHIPNGTNACGTFITTDQRGFPRPVNTTCDIGAVEGAIEGTFYLYYFPFIFK